MNTHNPLIVTYGDISLDFSTLPQSSLLACLRGGVSHKFGSEIASKVTAYFASDDDGKMEDTKENREKLKAEYRAKLFDAMLAGTVGVSVRGPSVDPITVIVQRLAKKEVLDVLKASGTKPPKKSDDKVTFANGDKFTLAELVARRLDSTRPSGVDKKTGVPHIDRLTKEAGKIAKEQAAKADKAIALAKEEGLEAL